MVIFFATCMMELILRGINSIMRMAKNIVFF